jgi:large subunit ribosomal protein L2
MAIKRLYGNTPSRRFMTGINWRKDITCQNPEKSLVEILPKQSGRDVHGHVSMRHQGGREKRFLRRIDWKRDKMDVSATVFSIEYDPNRTANIALLHYADGEKRYIIAPSGLHVGDKVISAENAEIKTGNSLKLKNIPLGIPIHNLELVSGRGAKLVRSAGSSALILSKEGDHAAVKMPSAETRKILLTCRATIGVVSNEDWSNVVFGKAGRKRHMGIRPTVRGVAQDPRSHPHGGGEGRSGIGLKKGPKTKWGKKAFKKTRDKKKWSEKLIIEHRRK